jgi:hypothetical protein
MSQKNQSSPAQRTAHKKREIPDRKTDIYGVCVRNRSNAHRCFNRDYEILARKLTESELNNIKTSAVQILDQSFPWLDGTKLHDQEDWKVFYVYH